MSEHLPDESDAPILGDAERGRAENTRNEDPNEPQPWAKASSGSTELGEDDERDER